MASARRASIAALGARATSLLRLVLSRGLTQTAFGVLLGVAAVLLLTRFLDHSLYHVNSHDPLTFAAAFGVMLVTSFAACLLPARHAARTDPVPVLPQE